MDLPYDIIIFIFSFILPELQNIDFVNYKEKGDTNKDDEHKIAISLTNKKYITNRDKSVCNRLFLTKKMCKIMKCII